MVLLHPSARLSAERLSDKLIKQRIYHTLYDHTATDEFYGSVHSASEYVV